MTDTVVFLHGRGEGPEKRTVVEAAFAGAHLLAPTGGVALRRGHTWFENVRTGVAKPESVLAAEQRLLAWLAEHVAPTQPVWLAGFSNGGALAAHLLLRHPHRFQGAALFAAPLVLPPWPAGSLAGKRVFYAYGDASDTVVDQQFFAQAAAFLLGPSGSDATVRRYAAAHTLTPAMVEDCREWFQRRRSS